MRRGPQRWSVDIAASNPSISDLCPMSAAVGQAGEVGVEDGAHGFAVEAAAQLQAGDEGRGLHASFLSHLQLFPRAGI